MNIPLLHLHNLSHQWGSGQRPSATPLFTLSGLSLQAGERFFISGPSGCGKSTLLNIITGLLPPTQGEVLLNGQSLYQLKPSARDRLRAQSMGVITQSLNLLPYLTVSENLQLMQQFAGKQSASEWQQHLLRQLNLSEQAGQRVEQLSIGQQQRAAIARALIHKPPLIIADEPTSALDDDNKNAFMQLLLNEMQNFDTALLMVSHDRRLQPHFHRTLDLSAAGAGHVA